MVVRICIIVLVLCCSTSVFAQESEVIPNNENYQFQSEKQQQQQTQSTTQVKKTIPYKRTWSFGGNIGLSFWNGGTDILLAPKAYYNISPQFLAGFGLTYIYSSAEDDFAKYSQNSFGPSIMGAWRPIPYLQLSAEYEGLQTSGDGRFKIGDRDDYDYSYWNNAIYLGASFVSRNVSFGVRYDILYDSTQSVYGSAWSPVIGFYF